MIRPLLRLALTLPAIGFHAAAHAQARTFTLEDTAGLRMHNVHAQTATHDGKTGVRVVADTIALSRLPAMTGRADPDMFALVDRVSFSSGTIEAEISGVPAPGAGEGARGFVGIAFRVQDDLHTYDAFYLRPTNGRADDQERRNHAAQYISHPDWPWYRFRDETPSRYESYVDLVPDAWTKVRIEVNGAQARLYVHDQRQPTLVVNDLKTGAMTSGGIALWIGSGTIAYFRNVVITPQG